MLLLKLIHSCLYHKKNSIFFLSKKKSFVSRSVHGDRQENDWVSRIHVDLTIMSDLFADRIFQKHRLVTVRNSTLCVSGPFEL